MHKVTHSPDPAASKKYTAVITIVDFFKGERVLQNVQALLAQENCPDIKICVIDNSCDKKNRQALSLLDDYDNVHLKFNKSNEGYIRACNDAASRFKARYIILVNPDISWKSSQTLSELIELMDNNPDIGIAGPRQVNDDGSTPDTVRNFPSFPILIARRTPLRHLPFLKKHVEHYERSDFDYSKSQYVDWIQSSLLIIRGELWNKLGGLDTGYFIFMADPDICFKAWEHGYKVFYTAESLVGADGKRCSEGGLRQLFKSRAIRYHIRDALVYQIKHLFRKHHAITQKQLP